MQDVNFWFNIMDSKAGRFTVQEDWEGDTTKYIKSLKDQAPNKQTKTYLDGLLKHLGKEGFLSDEQKSSLANITSNSKGGDSDAKDTSSGAKDTSKEKPSKEEKKKIKKETGKEIKKQIGSLLGKLGGVGKELASKVDSKAVDAIDKGVAGGKNVKDATKDVIDKIASDAKEKKEAKELEKKKKEEKKKQEQAKKKTKKEGFGYRFRDYLR